MKLNEITASSEFLTNKDDIREWLDKHNLRHESQRYAKDTPDGVVVNYRFSDVKFGKNTILYGKNHLPVNFHHISGNVLLDGVIPRSSKFSLKGCPEEIEGNFTVSNLSLNDLEYFPKTVSGDVVFHNCSFSLKGVENFIGKIGGKFQMNYCSIVEGGIGLVLCKGINPATFNVEGTLVQSKAFNIIIKHFIGKEDEVFDCQEELIEQGDCDQFAEL